jgi:putative inorganic carbon (HCO3(-)) transporter
MASKRLKERFKDGSKDATGNGDGRAARPVVSPCAALESGAGSDLAAAAVYGGLFLALCLGYSSALESKFALPKAIVLCAGVLALGMLLAVRTWRGLRHPPPRWALLLSLALASWWMVSTQFALHLPTALNGEYNRYNGLWTHLSWLALFVASLALPATLGTVRSIVALLIAAILPVALIAVLETTGTTVLGLGELSTLGDRVAASALINFALPFVAIGLFRVRHWGLKVGLGAVLALLLVSELLSQGRGPWMGLIVAAMILAAGLIRSRTGWKFIGAMLLAVLMLAGAAVKLSPAVGQRFATLTQLSQDASLKQRFVLYRAALRAIEEHPLAGVGFDNFRNSYPTYRSAEDSYYFKNIIPTMVHSGYLQVALSNGIPALLLYLALVAGVLIKLARQIAREKEGDRRDLLLGFLAVLSAYLVQDLVGWLDMAVTSIFWVMLGLALNLASQDAPRPAGRWTKPAVALCSGLMLLLSLYLLGDRYARVVADSSLYRAQSLDVQSEWSQVESLVEKALTSLPGDSRTEMTAAELYGMRYVATHEARAYARSRALFESSYEHNRFDRLRLFAILALESMALESGTIQTASKFSQDAIATLAKTDSDNPAFHEIAAGFISAQKRVSER